MNKYFHLFLLLFAILLSNIIYANNQLHLIDVAKQQNWDVYSLNVLNQQLKDNKPDYFKLGLLFLAHKDYAQAELFFTKTKYDDALFYRAYIKYQQSQIPQSLKLIEPYVAINKNISGFSLYADILSEVGDFASLDKLFNQADKHKISDITLLYKKGMLYLTQNRCNEAINVFQKLLKQAPKSTRVNKPLSHAYKQCNKIELAMEYSQKEAMGTIISHDPMLIALYEYGNPAFLLKPKMQSLITAKKYTEALAVAQDLIKIQTNDENIWINYGSLLVKNNKKTEAIEAYKQAFVLNSNNEVTLQNLIKIHWNQDKGKANHWLDVLLKLNPKHFTALRVKGDYYMLQQKPVIAIKYYNQALQQNPEDIYILRNITKIHIDANNSSQAVHTLDKAFRITGNNITIANFLVRALVIKNNTESLARALRISRTIYKLRADYTNKFALLMALRANRLEAEANTVLSELKQKPLKPSQKKYQDGLEALENYDSLMKNLNSDWIW